MRRIGLYPGTWTGSLGFLLGGAFEVLSAGEGQNLAGYLAWVAMVIGFVVLVWGITIDGKQWWKRGAQSETRMTDRKSHKSLSNKATGARRLADGSIVAGDGGDGTFWGGGGGGAGGLSVGPDGAINAGGGGGGGGISPGGSGGGELGGGGGGASGAPLEFLNSSDGRITILLWELEQSYAAEHPSFDKLTGKLPEDWANEQIRSRGLNLTYSLKDGNPTFEGEI